MELHFEISDKLAELFLTCMRRKYNSDNGRLIWAHKGPHAVVHALGIMLESAVRTSPEMSDLISTNKFGGWEEPLIEEVTVGGLAIIRPLK